MKWLISNYIASRADTASRAGTDALTRKSLLKGGEEEACTVATFEGAGIVRYRLRNTKIYLKTMMVITIWCIFVLVKSLVRDDSIEMHQLRYPE